MHETAWLEDGLCRYGRGLNMLHEVLDEADCTTTTEIIVSVKSLSLAEVCALLYLLEPLHSPTD